LDIRSQLYSLKPLSGSFIHPIIKSIVLKINICMTSVGIEDPELKTQNQIDKMFSEKEEEKS
jgi:hypothetical protein